MQKERDRKKTSTHEDECKVKNHLFFFKSGDDAEKVLGIILSFCLAYTICVRTFKEISVEIYYYFIQEDFLILSVYGVFLLLIRVANFERSAMAICHRRRCCLLRYGCVTCSASPRLFSLKN